MLSMDRNTNLEEIQNGALFGVKYLLHQTIGQKIIFYGAMVAAIVFLLWGSLSLDLNMNPYVMVVIAMIPAAIAVLFGCNYNQDMSVFKYFVHLIKKPYDVYLYKSTEDTEYIKAEMQKTKLEDEAVIARQAGAISTNIKKQLIKLIIIVVAFFIAIVGVIVYKNATKNDGLHHTIIEEVAQ